MALENASRDRPSAVDAKKPFADLLYFVELLTKSCDIETCTLRLVDLGLYQRNCPLCVLQRVELFFGKFDAHCSFPPFYLLLRTTTRCMTSRFCDATH